MEANEVITNTAEHMEKTINVLKHEMNSIRAGRANPQLLDNVKIDYYGTPTPVAQVGNVSAPEPRMLVISPWDPKLIPLIEKAIRTSELGINPINDGKVIRLGIPELTEERRKDLVKTVSRHGEEAKVAIRNVRRDANDHLKKLQKSNDITEDELKHYEDDIQKLTDRYSKTVEDVLKDKEKEILRV
jgi:ribosome recycling factor